MRATIKIRVRDDSFIDQLKEWIEETGANVSIQVGSERWIHFGKAPGWKPEAPAQEEASM